MGTQAFPSLPGLRHVERETMTNTTVYTSASGKEQRVTWWATPRFRYTLTYSALREAVAAPSPWEEDSEIGVVQRFFDEHAGAFDSFNYTDPRDGIVRQVRFEEDSLKTPRLVDGYWTCSFSLLSLK